MWIWYRIPVMNRQTLTVGSLIGLALILSPFIGAAAQRAITVDSLEKAYAVRIAYFDSQIASTTKAYNELDAKIKATPRTPASEYMPLYSMKGELKKFNEDKETLGISYDLLIEALK
jgi:hypothetical protein